MLICLVAIEADHWRIERGDSPTPVSGMGEMIRLTAQGLRDAGIDVIAALPPTPSLRAALEPYCSAFVDLVPPASRSSFGRNVGPILRLARRYHPDIVHFHVPHYRWALDAISTTNLTRRTKVVRTEHNPMMHAPEQPYRAMLRLADAAVDRFVYVSAGNRRRFEQLMPWRRPGAVAVNVVDPERLRQAAPSARGDATLAMISELPPGTRTAIFIAGSWQVEGTEGRRPVAPILAAMADLGDDWHLVVAGNGDEARAQAVADGLGLRGRVHFLGAIPDASRVTAACDLLVSASHFEGLSVSYLEAWFQGVPVLSTIVDGIEDVVGAEHTASITAPHGDRTRFAELWRQAGVEGSPFDVVSRIAIERVRSTFTPRSYGTDMLAIYHDVLAGG